MWVNSARRKSPTTSGSTRQQNVRTKETYGAEGKKSGGERQAEITEGQRKSTRAAPQKIYGEQEAATVRISRRTRNITI